MKLCRFGDNRLGLVEGDNVRDVTAAIERLRARANSIMLGEIRHEGLFFQHDTTTGLVTLQTTVGIAVTPAHTGMMSEYLLPLGLQLMIRGFGTAPTLFQPESLLAPQPLPDQVRSAPRIETGLVTLRRASWSVPPELVPRRQPGDSDARHLLRLHGWLAEHGIPDRCFVKVSAPAGPNWLASAFTKARKPLYVDLASPLQLAVFERMLAAPAEHVVFREALPQLVEAVDPDPADPRVTEFIIETTETGAGAS